MFSILERISQCSLIAGYYHLVGDRPPTHIKHLYACKTARQFIQDIDFLLRRYTPIDARKLIEHVKGRVPLPRKAVLLTFDDGFREVFDVIAPILRCKGTPAVFFVTTGFLDNLEMGFEHKKSIIIEHILSGPSRADSKVAEILSRRGGLSISGLDGLRQLSYLDRSILDVIGTALEIDFGAYLREYRPYLTNGQLRSLAADGFSIGAHSIDHPPYREIPLAEQIRQTVGSLDRLKSIYALPYGLFAFPHSDRGVSSQFFDHMDNWGGVDLTFGTSGLLDDARPHHIQRMSFERPVMPVKRSLQRHLIRRFYRQIRGTGTIQHPSAEVTLKRENR